MKIFHCPSCDQLVFFENTSCVACGHSLAYLPDCLEMGAFELIEGTYRWSGENDTEFDYRRCANYETHHTCNWAVRSDDPSPFCLSCELTRTIPDLGKEDALEQWSRLEAAKRRLIYTLQCLKLPIASKSVDPENGLSFEFLADSGVPGEAPVLTGHADGLITINIAESDDVEREKRRNLFHEPYRTVLGHFRHEIGHYYWDRLIRDTEWLKPFRAAFGDEQADYAEALKQHHDKGAPLDWGVSFVSAYASTHPWEDWAETWAHYLHITDTLETSNAAGLTLRPRRGDEPSLKPDHNAVGQQPHSFDKMMDRWFSLTYVLNNLTRGMGVPDAYPFVLSAPAVEKLRFVHNVIEASVRAEASVNH